MTVRAGPRGIKHERHAPVNPAAEGEPQQLPTAFYEDGTKLGALQAATDARHLSNLLAYVLSADEAELRAAAQGRPQRKRQRGDAPSVLPLP